MCLLLIVLLINNIVLNEGSLRVYGGRDALPSEFPYVVRLETLRFFNNSKGKPKKIFTRFCTGATLTQTWILSAAHCYDESLFKNKKVVARYNSYFPKDLGNTSNILEVKIHPSYYYRFIAPILPIFKNDIGLFRSENIIVDSYGKLSPVDYRSLIGHEAYTLGFGVTNASEYEKPLQVLKGMLYDCLKEQHRQGLMLCLAPQCDVKTTICGGDSGGPIVHASGIVGVNSMSVGDCDENSKFLDVKFGTAASELQTVSPVYDWLVNVITN